MSKPLPASIQRRLLEKVHQVLRDGFKPFGVRVVMERAVEEEKHPVVRVSYVRDTNARNIYVANAATLTDRKVVLHLEVGAEERMALDIVERAWFILNEDFRADKSEPGKWGLHVAEIWWDSSAEEQQDYTAEGTVKIYRMGLEFLLQRVVMFPAPDVI